MALIGLGYRQPLSRWIDTDQELIQCLEITAEHFFDGGEDRLRELAARFPLYVHGLGLSLGTPGPLDRKALDQFVRVVEIAQPEWISEHIAFSRSEEVDLGHLNPLPRTRANIEILAEHVAELRERCGKPVILENITSQLDPGGSFSEPDFLNRLCERAECGLLLDVTNLYVNGMNHDFNPLIWLQEVHSRNIKQLHVVGFDHHHGAYQDGHGAVIQPDLMDLIVAVAEYSQVPTVILERDQRLDAVDEIADELRRLRGLLGSEAVSR